MLSKSVEKCHHHLLQTDFAGIWQSRGKSVRVNDLDECSRRGCHPSCAAAEAGEERERGGGGFA